MMKRIGVIGAGAWGTTLANLLAEKSGTVHLWVYEKDLCEIIRSQRENVFYLPGHKLNPRVVPTASMAEAAEAKDLIVSAVPSQFVRPRISEVARHIRKDALLLSASKGIEMETLKLMSHVFEEVLPSSLAPRIAFLSGPSFATEVAQKVPTAVTVAAHDPAVTSSLQELLNTPYFRVYTSKDVVGVQLGGALKNVIAIAVGAADGIGFGHNTRAALITRGLAEITRLGVAMGADPLTFQGLSGMGDLVLTCTGDLSRNRTVGRLLGQGKTLQEILKTTKSVAEGVTTTRSAYQLAQRLGVEMPITESVYAILFEGEKIGSAVERLLKRRPAEEIY